MDPAGWIGRPVVAAVLGGYWELTLEPDSVALNVDRLGPPLDQMVKRATEVAVESLSRPQTQRRLLLEIAEGRFSYLHDYDLEAGTGVRVELGDVFPPRPEPEVGPPPPPVPELRSSWPGRALWLEPEDDGQLVLVIREPPTVTELGDLSAVVRPVARVSGVSPPSMRFTIIFELDLVAECDFPVIPVFRVLDMQRGESFPAKLALTFAVTRSASPAELGLPRAEDVDVGAEVILPLGDLVRAALFDEKPEL